MFSIVVVTVHLEVVQVEEQWTWLHHLSIWLSQRECPGHHARLLSYWLPSLS